MFRIMEQDKTDGGVAALARGLELLRCFTPQATSLSNGELAERTGLPKSTVSRLTRTLVDLGYLHQDGRAYRVGPSVLALGYAALANLRVRDVARPHMQALADATQTLVSLATRDRLSMIYLENCRGANNVTLRVAVGTHLPLATTSIGRAFLAGLPAGERAFLLKELAAREGRGWRAQAKAVDRELARFSEKGYCLSLGDWQKDTNAAAVPLACSDGSDLFVLSVSGPAFAVTARQLEEDLAPRLVALARHIEGLMA
ncbi:HTH-type transcriptional regulator TsaQ1/TsaQ2 [Anaerolineae bacterium]|nr:HTH-type transcriptional regulator TsaQ1/TsaQ2 [Anaerolineae bacterium]